MASQNETTLKLKLVNAIITEDIDNCFSAAAKLMAHYHYAEAFDKKTLAGEIESILQFGFEEAPEATKDTVSFFEQLNIYLHTLSHRKVYLVDDFDSDDEAYYSPTDEDEDKEIVEPKADIQISGHTLLGTITPFLDKIKVGSLDERLEALEKDKRKQSIETAKLSHEFYLKLSRYKQMYKKLSSKPKVTELLLVADDDPDKDLQDVMNYRQSRNPNLLVIGMKNYANMLNFACENDLSSMFPSIEKLGILHHSGRLLDESFDAYTSLIGPIGKSLPKASKIVLRGCGMANEGKAKDEARKVTKKVHHETESLTNALISKKLKDEAFLFFKRGSTTAVPIRQFTLDVDEAVGISCASKLTRNIISEFKTSGIGRDLSSKDKKTSLKYYVGGYKSSPETGTVADVGRDSRYGSAPKAIRCRFL